MSILINKDTKVIVRKDSEECGWVALDAGVQAAAPTEVAAAIEPSAIKAEELVISVNDSIETLSAGATLLIQKDSRLMLLG